MAVGKESNAFPIPLNMDLLERGENRYKIYCSPCHGLQETATHGGHAWDEASPLLPSGSFAARFPTAMSTTSFTNGFGAMLGYSAQIPPRDRWANRGVFSRLAVEPQRQDFGTAARRARKSLASIGGE